MGLGVGGGLCARLGPASSPAAWGPTRVGGGDMSTDDNSSQAWGEHLRSGDILQKTFDFTHMILVGNSLRIRPQKIHHPF